MRGNTRKYLAEFVYGATDGAITTFAIISGVMGAGLEPIIILILGVSNVLADGFSMASSNYLSSKSDKDMGNGGDKSSIKTAVVTFGSFVLVGLVPLTPFIVKSIWKNLELNEFILSIIFTMVAFIIIGVIRGTVTGNSRTKSSVETVIIGGIAASIAYFVGHLLKVWTGLS
jgi:VIT1/CCC1 family predicted Fe2+/Mn2+ transporter